MTIKASQIRKVRAVEIAFEVEYLSKNGEPRTRTGTISAHETTEAESLKKVTSFKEKKAAREKRRLERYGCKFIRIKWGEPNAYDSEVMSLGF